MLILINFNQKYTLYMIFQQNFLTSIFLGLFLCLFLFLSRTSLERLNSVIKFPIPPFQKVHIFLCSQVLFFWAIQSCQDKYIILLHNSTIFNNYWIRFSHDSDNYQSQSFCVIGRSRRLRRITQTAICFSFSCQDAHRPPRCCTKHPKKCRRFSLGAEIKTRLRDLGDKDTARRKPQDNLDRAFHTSNIHRNVRHLPGGFLLIHPLLCTCSVLRCCPR